MDSRQQSVPLQVQSNQPMDLESLGLSFEMPQHGQYSRAVLHANCMRTRRLFRRVRAWGYIFVVF